MIKQWLLFFSIFSWLGSEAQRVTHTVDKGVSQALAVYRKSVVSGVHYTISLDIPPDKGAAIEGQESIRFHLKQNDRPLALDFKEEQKKVKEMVVNGRRIPIDFRHEHLLIDNKFLRKGANTVALLFTAGNLSLNRNNDYLYTLLVPDRARTLFPCFDQPDLKARFRLSLTVPSSWRALANGPLLDSSFQGERKTYRYGESDLIPTYLFSFVAGRFHHRLGAPQGRPMHFYHRETDSSKMRVSLDTIFGLHANALKFLEDYTGIPYPFIKFDFAAIPDFQYGGMEHVGAIDYKASSLFLDSGATRDQENSRSNLIAHETAHMWFGNLVTMRWFNDVWMKEVFANFMADKATQGAQDRELYELKFLLTHYPRAYSVDRTPGANPIRQPLDNLQEAGTLYGPIIYNKAPIMMRQLERLMGAAAFKNGVREYLKKYSFGNAAWPELISLLDARTPANLQAWNRVWVNSPGRPLIDYFMQKKGGRITRFSITQQGERQWDFLLPQFFEIALVYPGRVENHTVNMNRREVVLANMVGKEAPLYVVFNSSGQGYGQFPVDTAMLQHISDWKSPVMKAATYINLYENMLSGRYLKPKDLLALHLSLIHKPTEELTLGLVTGHISDIFWRLLKGPDRVAFAPALEAMLWEALERESLPNKKKVLFRTFQQIALSEAGLQKLYDIWKEKQPPPGVKLSEEDYTSLALNLAVKEYKAREVLQEQENRIVNEDRKARLQFLLPVLSSEEAVRDRFFASLKKQPVRKKEAWVADALGYLHHPLRAETSKKYLKESLEMLQEIQLTGDIFFPSAWLSATFGSYQTEDAARVVTEFLQANPGYNPKLKAKILQATDPLFRALKLLQ